MLDENETFNKYQFPNPINKQLSTGNLKLVKQFILYNR